MIYPVLNTDKIKYSVQRGCGFLDPLYFKATGCHHTGVDFNDTRGGNSDYGANVYSIAPGEVVAAGTWSVWGGIVLIYHPDFKVFSQYAHLINIKVKKGDAVKEKQLLGGIGRGQNNRYISHLHFEIRKSAITPNHWGHARFTPQKQIDYIKARYVNPLEFLTLHKARRAI